MVTYDVLVRDDHDYATVGTVEAKTPGIAAAMAARMVRGSSNVSDCTADYSGETIVVLDHRRRELCYLVCVTE